MLFPKKWVHSVIKDSFSNFFFHFLFLMVILVITVPYCENLHCMHLSQDVLQTHVLHEDNNMRKQSLFCFDINIGTLYICTHYHTEPESNKQKTGHIHLNTNHWVMGEGKCKSKTDMYFMPYF